MYLGVVAVKPAVGSHHADQKPGWASGFFASHEERRQRHDLRFRDHHGGCEKGAGFGRAQKGREKMDVGYINP